jgi:hypothetical protein
VTTEIKKPLDESDLANFTGTENWHRHWLSKVALHGRRKACGATLQVTDNTQSGKQTVPLVRNRTLIRRMSEDRAPTQSRRELRWCAARGSRERPP